MRNERGRIEPSLRGGATVLVFICAASAGAHAGLVPAHLNGEPRLGAAFLSSVMLLVAGATSVAARPGDRRITSAAGLLLGRWCQTVLVGPPEWPESLRSLAVG